MRSLVFSTLLLLGACWGSGSDPQPPPPPSAPAAPAVDIQVALKQLVFSWADVAGATHYQLYKNEDGHSGFTQEGADIPAGTLSVTLNIAVHLHDFTNALYFVQACNAVGCNRSGDVNAMSEMLDAIGYFKASNTDTSFSVEEGGESFYFGSAAALSADGMTLVVGASGESGNATGINGAQDNDLAPESGAAYVFRFDGTDWFQQAYVKASNTGGYDGGFQKEGDEFGSSVALSADGNTLAIGAPLEDSSATGINGDQDNDLAGQSGAVYIFRFDGAHWSQQAYVKASNTEEDDRFGENIALSDDGATLAVGAHGEDSNATGINGDQDNDLAGQSGAVYIFRFDGAHWSQQAYVKASNGGGHFGGSMALSDDGATLAVGAVLESSIAGEDWSQQAYVKASNTGEDDRFGGSVALSTDGMTLAVGAARESSNATGINGDQDNNLAYEAGAVYVFRFDGTIWSQQTYIKASNTEAGHTFGDYFGENIALSDDGATLAVGAHGEDSNATGIDGDQSDNSAGWSGAAYVFRFDGEDWSQQAYVKASNGGGHFGGSMALSDDGATLAVGAVLESSIAMIPSIVLGQSTCIKPRRRRS